jgi:anaerobic glycerol-3-phosphate dehydrogenase
VANLGTLPATPASLKLIAKTHPMVGVLLDQWAAGALSYEQLLLQVAVTLHSSLVNALQRIANSGASVQPTAIVPATVPAPSSP